MEVDVAIFFFEDRRQGVFGVVLRDRNDQPGFGAREGFDEKFGAQLGEAWREGFGGVVVADGHLGLQEHVAGIEASIDLHRRDAGDGFAHGDGPLDGRGAAIFRQ